MVTMCSSLLGIYFHSNSNVRRRMNSRQIREVSYYHSSVMPPPAASQQTAKRSRCSLFKQRICFQAVGLLMTTATEACLNRVSRNITVFPEHLTELFQLPPSVWTDVLLGMKLSFFVLLDR